MKIIKDIRILGTHNLQHQIALEEAREAIIQSKLILNPTKKGNGVRPIKLNIMSHLEKNGWGHEVGMDLFGMNARPLDAHKTFGDCRVGLEWETGNISSSFRAIMKLIKGLCEDKLELGIFCVPSGDMYPYLTDRIGNITELEPYLDIFGRVPIAMGKALTIFVVEHDELSKDVPLIPKGNDGMSLERRKLIK